MRPKPPTPADFGLPSNHKGWRKHQLNTIQWGLDLAPGQIGIVNAVTGSGKSALPAALGHDFKTIALVATLHLQNQYRFYDFVTIFGRRHYPCIHPQRLFNDATAEDCIHSDGMHKCTLASLCPYLLQKERARNARKSVLSYPYWNLVGRGRNKLGTLNWQKDYVILDEAHEIAHSCLSFFSLRIDGGHKQRWGLPDFPTITSGMPPKLQRERAMLWILDAKIVIGSIKKIIKADIKRKVNVKNNVKKLKSAERLGEKLGIVQRALVDCPDDWYIYGDGSGILVKPLTAKHIFPGLHLFDSGANVVPMSATIGNFGEFAKELGIEEYEARDVPSRFEPWQRSVNIYKECPPMSYTYTQKNPGAFDKQADIIAGILKDYPNEWSGFVHVTRKSEAILLKRRLDKRGLKGRIFSSPGHDGNYVPTSEQLLYWEQCKEKVPNAILVSWAFGTGVDGLMEKVNIVAKIKFPPWGSLGSYEEAWRKYSMSRYYNETVNSTIQALGRTRRGREEDYDTRIEKRGIVAIADGSFSRIRKRFPKSFLDSIIEV